ALNFGAFEPLVRWLVAFGERRQWSAFTHVVDLGARLQQIWRNHRGLSESFVVHLAAVFFGAAEVWIGLALWAIGSVSSRRWRSKAWGREAAPPRSCCRAVWAFKMPP